MKIKRGYLRFIEGDEGGAVSAPAETDALGGTVTPPLAAENPAWHAYVEKFPDPVKHIARETFAEWDKNTQGQFTEIRDRYRPYQQFVDNKVDPARLEAAYGVAEMLETDPQGFARLLTQQLGLTIQEAEAVAAQVEENQGQGAVEVDPIVKELQDKIAGFENYFQTQQQERENQQQEQSINAEFADIEKSHGALRPEIKDQVLKEALRISMTENRPVTMQEAYASLDKFAQIVRSVPRPGQLAPQVLSGSGSVPVSPPSKPMGQLTSAETRSYVAELLAREAAAN